MKRSSLMPLMVLALVAVAGPAIAQSQPAAKEAASLAEQANRLEKHRARLGELVARMDREMAAIYAADDPETRARLMAEHRSTMKEAIVHLSGLGEEWDGDSIMAHAEATSDKPSRAHRFHGPRRRPSPPSSESLSQRLDRLEIRVEMMQVLMEDMVEYVGDRG